MGEYISTFLLLAVMLTCLLNTLAPPQDALRYKLELFTSGFGDQRTQYMGNSTAADDAWFKLYPRTVVRIPKSSADKLVNKTIPIVGDEDHFPVLISVFHELHCLDSIRNLYYGHNKGIDPNPVINDAVLAPGHIDHCFDSLRQTLMCGADITPVPYEWVPSRHKALGSLGVPHTCRGKAHSHPKLLFFLLRTPELGSSSGPS
jgi:Mycotoxin biosynthesis protein UstYa